MTLTWADIDARWPDAGVLWDRDVAPTLDWEPRFVERDGVLWADDVEERGQWFHHITSCRCRVWVCGEWITHRQLDDRQIEDALRYRDCLLRVSYESIHASWPRHVWANPTTYKQLVDRVTHAPHRWRTIRSVLGANRPL